MHPDRKFVHPRRGFHIFPLFPISLFLAYIEITKKIIAHFNA